MKLRDAFCFALLLAACSKGSDGAPKADSRDVAPVSSAAAPQEKPPADVPGESELSERGDRYDLVTHAATCEAHHRGQLLDLGTPAAPIWQSFQARPLDEAQNVTRDGATLLRPIERQLAYDFWLEEAAPTLDISVRVRGLTAKWLYVDVDGKRAGSVRLNDEEL